MSAGRSRVVLDADVLYSRVLHELFGRLAGQERLVDILWSDALLHETRDTLRDQKPMPELAAQRWVDYLREAFPCGGVDVAKPPAGVNLSALTDDPADEHVCALAVAGGADLLVTFDHGYRAEALSAHGVAVRDPDTVLGGWIAAEPDDCLRALESQAAVWAGGRTTDELLAALQRANAPQLPAAARVLLAD